MNLHYSPDGIHVGEIDLWLDPQTSKPAAWISHAHSDHARWYSQTVIGTSTSLEIYRMRWPLSNDVEQSIEPLDYGQSRDWNGARLTCYPAGHILGAAQLLIEYKNERIVYTGDIKLKPPLCGLQTQVIECDHLILESTFGLPIFQFLSSDQAKVEIADFARDALAEGATPVFMGYPLGRGQEIVHCLTQSEIPTAVHGAISKYIPVYEANGYAFPNWRPYDARQTDGHAVVVVPGMRRHLEAAGKNMRVAYVSGWARLDNARLRSGAEKLIPYSDHGGFDELLEIVLRSGAKKIDVIHGYTEMFARQLRDRGFDASAPASARARNSEEEAMQVE
jgi:Cft2 family RNA processing exonuclease